MVDQPQFFYAYQNPEHSVDLTFDSAEALTSWANRENNAWSTIISSAPAKLPNNVQNTFDRGKALLQNIFRAAKQYAENPNNDLKANLDNSFRDAFARSTIPLPVAAVRNFLQTVKVKRGERTMQAAFAALISPPKGNQWPLELSDPEMRAGIAAGTLYTLGLEPFADQFGSNTFREVIKQFESSVEKADALNRNYLERSEANLADFTKSSQDRIELAGRDFDYASAEFENEGRDALNSMRNTEATYREHMRLRAPTEYWATKAAQHRDSLKLWGWALLAYTIVAGAALLYGLWELARLSLPHTSADPSQYLRTAVIGLVATTLAVWIGRVLLRIFLSERHLATDADERVTLVMTYLSLTQDGSLEAADRPIVLAPLFRAATDGIVKDDGAPDTSMAAILTRGLSGAR